MTARSALAMVQTAARRIEPRDLPLPALGGAVPLRRGGAGGIGGGAVERSGGVLRVPLPLVPGHEPLGRIEAIGERAAKRWGVAVGDRVAVETLLTCGSCPRCRGGAYQLWAARRGYSYIPLSEPPRLWGAYAAVRFLPPHANLDKVDPPVPPRVASAITP